MKSPAVVIVIGGSSGIGRASALEFARSGASLVLVSRSQSALEVTAVSCRSAGATDVMALPADVTEAESLRRIVDTTLELFGRIDIVVHSAAVMAYGHIEDLSKDIFEKVVDTSIHGTANLARLVLPVFRRQGHGSLIVVSSLMASIAAPGMGAYATAKWGQLGLIRSLQLETRDLPKVHVCAVAPGGVNTPIYYQAATVTGSTGRPPPIVYSPQRVAKLIADLVKRPRRVVHSGLLNPLIIAGFRVFPSVFDFLVGPLFRQLAVAHDSVEATNGNVFESRPDAEATHGHWRSV